MKDFQIKRGGSNDLQATVQPRAGEGVLSLGEGQISAPARRPQENWDKRGWCNKRMCKPQRLVFRDCLRAAFERGNEKRFSLWFSGHEVPSGALVRDVSHFWRGSWSEACKDSGSGRECRRYSPRLPISDTTSVTKGTKWRLAVSPEETDLSFCNILYQFNCVLKQDLFCLRSTGSAVATVLSMWPPFSYCLKTTGSKFQMTAFVSLRALFL